MKRLLLIFIGSWMALAVSAQGIEFFHGTYDEALEKARTGNKQIFVDVYTSWCGPCKKMAKEVFTLPEVGTYFNEHFICLQLDAEKQKEHPFFQKYQVSAFPSFFWLDAQGRLQDTHVGYIDAEKFLALAAVAGKSDLNKRLEEGEKRWEGGERTLELIQSYVLEVLGKVHPERVKPRIEEYLKGLSEEQLKAEENYRLLRMFMREAGDNLSFRTLIKNAETYQQYEEGYTFWINMYRMVVRSGIIYRSEPQKYQNYLLLLQSIHSPLADMYREILQMEYALFQKDFKKGIPEATALITKYKKEHSYLAGQFFYTLIIAGFFEEKDIDSELADQVIDMADKALHAVPSKENLLYLSAAYAKKGDYKKAYEIMASEPFFPAPVLSNALYKHLGLPVFHREYLKQ